MKATELISALVEHVARHGDREVEAHCESCDSAYHGVDSVGIIHVRTIYDEHYDMACLNLTEE